MDRQENDRIPSAGSPGCPSDCVDEVPAYFISTRIAATLATMSLRDLFGVGLALSLIGAVAVIVAVSPLGRTRFSEDWLNNSSGRAGVVGAWVFFMTGYGCLVVASIWYLTAPR